jgi:hypothetical protein
MPGPPGRGPLWLCGLDPVPVCGGIPGPPGPWGPDPGPRGPCIAPIGDMPLISGPIGPLGPNCMF